MLENAAFIEYPGEFIRSHLSEDPAPLFRRHFVVKPSLEKAVLSVCGLGYGYYYINGLAVSGDLFTAPVSDYTKTLWYNSYDVTDLLPAGEVVIAAILGNGFYNESIISVWGQHNAPWRGAPKLLLELQLTYADKTECIITDESWVCNKKESPVRYNQLRSGETYDSRFTESWREVNYDDSEWVHARLAKSIPAGVLRECRCQPVRENAVYRAKRIFQNAEGKTVLDFGQNISGYVRLKIDQPQGDVITIRYAEQLKDDGTRELNSMDSPNFYKESAFQTDRFICNGSFAVWSPRFTYHGFRYIELEGLRELADENIAEAVFVHQAVEELSDFECSDDVINKLYRLGKLSTLSNLFYMPTDCPTREKLGWTNDVQASAEQMLQNFNIMPLFDKWLQDILDSMKEDGAIPCIVPTGGWGYEWGAGPVSSGVLFELPMQIYQYTGDSTVIRKAYPAFIKHLKYITDQTDPHDGLIGYGLCDWAGPFDSLGESPTPVKFSDTLLTIKFLRMAAFAARICSDLPMAERLLNDAKNLETVFKATYLDACGRCVIHEQTAAAMIIALKIYSDLEPLKKQMYELLKERDFHHHCGMLGMQYLYPALDICGFQEEAYLIVTAKGRPSYTEWLDNGATTMWETWNTGNSKNHHMHSCVLSWFMKTVLGLRPMHEFPGFTKAEIRPYFLTALNFCRGTYHTAAGTYTVSWMRKSGGTILLQLQVPENTQVRVVLDSSIFDDYDVSELTLPAGKYHLLCRLINQPD